MSDETINMSSELHRIYMPLFDGEGFLSIHRSVENNFTIVPYDDRGYTLIIILNS